MVCSSAACMSSCGVTLCALLADLGVSLSQHSGCDSTNNQTLITASTQQHTMKSRNRGQRYWQHNEQLFSLSLSRTCFLAMCFVALSITRRHNKYNIGCSTNHIPSGCFDSSVIRPLKKKLHLNKRS